MKFSRFFLGRMSRLAAIALLLGSASLVSACGDDEGEAGGADGDGGPRSRGTTGGRRGSREATRDGGG